MDEERTIISCITTVLVALITNALVYMITRLNDKNTKSDSILREQYERIFAPIHKILYFDKPEKDKFKYIEIKEIISNNYSFLPEAIRSSFLKIDIDKSNKEFEDFKKINEKCFKYLRSRLGYSREKLSKDERKSAKKIINCKSEDLILSKKVTTVVTIVTLVSFAIYYLLCFTTNNSTISFFVTLIISIIILAIFTINMIK